MDVLSNEELQARVKQFTQSKNTIKESSNLSIEETEEGFKIDSLICTGFPKAQASILLLICNGLSRAQCASALNKSFSHVSRNVNSICLKLLGSNADGNPDGDISAAVLRAFNWAYLFHENISVFKANPYEWDLLMTHFKLAESPASEAVRLVFVEGKTINEAVIETGNDLKIVILAVRGLEQMLGQTLEIIHQTSN